MDSRHHNINESYHRIKNLQNNNPIGSLVFCAHNEEDYLYDTIEHISRLSTALPIEIIAINNASSDRTEEILVQSGIKVFAEEEKGLSYARNLSLKVAKGDIIFQTDADTLIPPTWIDAHHRHYSDSRIVGVSGGIAFDKVHKLYHLYRFGAISLYKFLELLGRINLNGGANLSYRKDVAVESGGFFEGANMGEDRILQLNLLKYGIIKQVRDDTINVITSGRRMNDSKRIKAFVCTRLNTLFKTILNKGNVLTDEDFENVR